VLRILKSSSDAHHAHSKSITTSDDKDTKDEINDNLAKITNNTCPQIYSRLKWLQKE
jgi:hypothetical protein